MSCNVNIARYEQRKDCNKLCFLSIGSIFGIWKKPENIENPIDCILQSGEHLRCAGYAVYGSACMLVLATTEGVNGFTLDPVRNRKLCLFFSNKFLFSHSENLF